MVISTVLIARLLMADELDYSVTDLRDMYIAETNKPVQEQDQGLIEELTLAINEAADSDKNEAIVRDNEKWLVLTRILDAELEKPEAEKNVDLIGEILDYLDEKGWR